MSETSQNKMAAAGNALINDVLGRFGHIVSNEDVGLTFRLYETPLANHAGRYVDGAVNAIGAKTPFYPASVCKLFYLAAAHAFEEAGHVTLDAEDQRAIAAMIRYSSNEATCYVLSRLTGTENGAILDDAAMADWWARRKTVQAYFDDLQEPAYEGLRLWHGTYEESPYGREKAVRKHGGNLMTPLAAATLLHDIMTGQSVSPTASQAMRDLLWRDWERSGPRDPGQPPDQIEGFLAQDLPATTRVWSKAGLTSETRHDVIAFELENGASCVAAAFTKGVAAAESTEVLPYIGAALHLLTEQMT
ncbi:serine hydrolase [Shimia sp. SDUM112013]|uniref:serine hydrolase n=1 Tax=Shimia sp. SDUM112013 TaxID=3136160 RepID=UPI0032EB9456